MSARRLCECCAQPRVCSRFRTRWFCRRCRDEIKRRYDSWRAWALSLIGVTTTKAA